jgi:hypothetical protein
VLGQFFRDLSWHVSLPRMNPPNRLDQILSHCGLQKVYISSAFTEKGRLRHDGGLCILLCRCDRLV